MSERIRLRRSAALLVAAVTTGSALALTACDPEGDSAGGGSSSAAATAPANSASASGSSSSAPAKGGTLNKTAGTKLTVSTGTNIVLMDGKSVDFGTVVRDLAWSPDGKHAAFIDGNGNLETSDPDGSHKTVLAKAPSGVTWSHPTWQVYGADEPHGAGTFVLFTADDKKKTTLMSVEAKAGSTPELLGLGATEDGKSSPDTGNTWPNSAGKAGWTVYGNKDGQVYYVDVIGRTNGGSLTKGSQPATDDHQEVVFVRSVNGHSHIFAKASFEGGGKETDLTPDATADCTEPAITHDGKTVAYRSQDGIYTVPAKGGKAEKITDTVGLPAYRS